MSSSASESATSLDVQKFDAAEGAKHEAERYYSESGTHSVEVSDDGDGRIPVTLTWKDVNYRVPLKAKKKCCKVIEPGRIKTILSDMTGVVRPGEFLAIMGPSGAGKSSLINILAGKYHKGVEGEIRVNGQIVTRALLNKCAAIVAQDDLLIPTLTPYEILVFSARLRLPKTWNYKKKMDKVESVIAELGLQNCRDTRIGAIGGAVGISGGERKRVSIAVELLTNPSLLIVDEPTSGLDSTTAESVVRTLMRLSQTGRTVICTIHQPSSQIYALFDKLLLLTRGKTAYFGKAGPAAVEFFGDQGYLCPANFNPSDYFLKLLADKRFLTAEERQDAFGSKDSKSKTAGSSSDSDSDSSDVEDKAKKPKADELDRMLEFYANSALAKHVHESTDQALEKSAKHAIDTTHKSYNVSIFLQSWLLLKRAVQVEGRTPILFKARLFQTCFLGLVVGLIFQDIGLGQTGYQDRTGSLYFLGIQMIMPAVFGNLQTLPAELPLFKREHGNGMYGVTPYYIAKVLADVPSQVFFPFLYCTIAYFLIGYQTNATKFFNMAGILILMGNAGVSLGFAISAAAPNGQVALVAGPLVMVVLMLFGGLFRNVSTLPSWIGWIQYISPLRWGYELLIRNEFSGLQFECPVGTRCAITDGTQAINLLGFNKYDWYEPFVILAAIMLGAHLLALIFMHIRVRASRK